MRPWALAYIADPKRIGRRAYREAYPKSSQRAAETRFGRLLKNGEFSARIAELGLEPGDLAAAALRKLDDPRSVEGLVHRGVWVAKHVTPREPDHADQQIDQHGQVGIHDVVAHQAKIVVREHMPLNNTPPPRRERGQGGASFTLDGGQNSLQTEPVSAFVEPLF
jgi:hypothetical protein